MRNELNILASASGSAEVSADNCAEEQIRIPGAIQPHGFLLCLDEPHEKIVVASENAEDFLATPMKLILGSPIELVIERELLSAIRQQRCAVEPDGMVSYLGAFRIKGELFSVITHCIEGKRILEFERQDRLVGAEMMNSIITNFVGTLSKLETQEELCAAVTQQVAQLTGFDRVLLYSFDEEGNGTVLSEANSGRLPSYLDLRFPASDIPRQARDLYVLNTVRIIPDAGYTPSPLRAIAAEAPHILDLSLSVLRSVSPIHLEYMRNMGTMSSMSISIVSEGRLWGLISGHHAEPRMVPYLVRSACDMLSKLVGTQLTTFRTASRLNTLMQFHAVQRQLLTQVAAEFNYLSALAQQMDSLQRITEANGAALWIDGECHRIGGVPETIDIRRIVEWLDGQPQVDVFTSQHLGALLPWAADLADVASGLLAIRISDVRQRYVLWFRPQIVRTVRWAGEPVKTPDAAHHLHPRKSFETWRETLRGQSRPWSEVEIESAREFRAAILTVSLRRAEEEAELSNARFEQLTHALPAKVFTANDNGELTYTNERWREQGLKEKGVWFSNGHLAAEDESRIAERWQYAVETGNDFEEEARFLTEGGVARWNLIRVVPFRRQGAARAGWVGSAIDLTERREREAALRMTEKLALTGRMTSVIAHEINNPLESITNLLYLVRQDLPEGAAAAASYITQAESELERISGITKQTLRWGRENSGGTERFAAGAIFADVLRLFRGKLRNRHVTATVRGGDTVELEGVLGQIRQVVANLVSNAIDAAPVGGNVWMEARHPAEGRIEILIGDDGPGISPEHRAQLFQPFFSTKGDLGNGLGLYISREITERHGGELFVETSPDAGTVMHLILPEHAQVHATSESSEQSDELLLS
jgi:PAS domain S-box-containing protein